MSHPHRLIILLGVVGLLLLSVSAAAAHEATDRPPHPTHPGTPARPGRLTWIPFRIVQQVAAGQTVQVTASFVSSTELHDIRLVVPGSLGRLVTVAPAHFDTVAANTPVAVTFTIAMPAQHAHNQGGVVLVRAGQGGISQPLHIWVGVSARHSDQAQPASGHPASGHPKHPPHGPKGD